MNDEGRRVEVEVDVPGTPEEVWQAIATGPGYTAWFVPTRIEEREGGEMVMDHGPGLGEDRSTVTRWEPPWHFGARSDELGIAHEVFIEAREGGICRVRLVNSGFGSDWDQQLDNIRRGWRIYLTGLRLYLERFPGREATPFMASATATADKHAAWAALTAALGVASPHGGDRIAASGDHVPPLGGTVEYLEDTELLMRLDEPAPGHAFVGAASLSVGDTEQTVIALRGYLFGSDRAAVAGRDEPVWRRWLERVADDLSG
jgi:uncharacterized protein YndB with AHSA1/START domain